MCKEYKYPAHRCLHPSPEFDKNYVVSSLTQAFHLIFGLSVGIGIGMVMCGVTRAIGIVIISALGYLGTETDVWFRLPARIFRLVRNDYPNASPAPDSFDLHLPDDRLGEKSGPDMEETPNITEMEDEENGGFQSEDDGGSRGVV